MENIQTGQEIQQALEALKARGGRLHLPAGEYPLTAPLHFDNTSTVLQGDSWSYSMDPNGVFETQRGTKLKLRGKDFPAICVGTNALPAGASLRDFGIQGDIIGMDTRGLLNPQRISDSAGLCFKGCRVDQAEFSKLSFCGLSCGVCVLPPAEIDACIFEKLNTDGCGIGIYFAPLHAYYAHFRHCVVADTPSYGFFMDGSRGGTVCSNDITDMNFVRNCGSDPLKSDAQAAVYLKQISDCSFRDNLIEAAGQFWYYAPDATSNDERQRFLTEVVGLKVVGNRNRITNNIINASSGPSMEITGNGNILLSNICDKDVILEGENNVVHSLVFTRPEARLILKGAAAHSTEIFAVAQDRIVRN